MTRPTLLLFIAINVAACQKAPTKIVLDPDNKYVITYSINKEDSTYQGVYTKVDSNGTLYEKGYYRNDTLSGIRELYYADGQVKVRERYKNGQIDDLYELFHPNGKIELQGYYVNGEMYGMWRKYLDDGSLFEEVMMQQNLENGPFTEYFKDGTIQTEGYYLHGDNEHGLLKLYNESGELYKTMLCDSGRCYTQWEKK
jgi:antitoxin component YwqK of YwqJK toxin-antitoxin module